ncbi:pimeloyl-ACP methyl ester esterase BioH [Vibrio sp. JC009]|uniref:pimeloyl-ACP methyl ester esterase BioH n=1 Tax=Vibrio sp. JC009 TaxID=2912314 RepID=UPI0023B0E2EB|nr:pimeloyl-ACP methyl ester esterase BioH [Vibrio sp. JC009]WED21940.1 pimeloyl-ACP methyl ester esterase BioH [Vibrio sp. JC009]
MSAPLFWQTLGEGEDVVLIHGWGMNGAVWQQTADILSQHYRVHIVDLPGYGHSAETGAQDLDEIASLVLDSAPDKAIWIGWSLGGLVATHVALNYPQRVAKLITVASSPKFAAEKGWRGIKPQVLKAFTEQLVEDFQTTIERFMALQAMGSPTARQDVKTLKKAVLSRPAPDQDSLVLGLSLLADVDFRSELKNLTMPILRLYGRLDGLVPVKVAKDVANYIENSEDFTFAESSHAPFMTELEAFCSRIIQFIGK